MMRYVKSLITLLCVTGLCLLLGACGKSDDVVGNKYKAIYKNKVEAIVEFKDDGELIYTVANGALNAGREEHGKYEVIKENGKMFLLVTPLKNSDFFEGEVGSFQFGTYIVQNKQTENSEGMLVFLLNSNNNKFEVYQTQNKETHDVKRINGKEEIKDLEAIKEENVKRFFEKVEWSLSIISKYEKLRKSAWQTEEH